MKSITRLYQLVAITLVSIMCLWHPLAIIATTVDTGINTTSSSVVNSMIAQIPQDFLFTQDLYLGFNGDQVKMLQILLNTDSRTVVSQTGAGSPGNETTNFGYLTKDAAERFQTLYKSIILQPIGYSNTTGIIGARSRSVLNQILDNLRNERSRDYNLGIGNAVTNTGNSNNTSTVNTRPTITSIVPSEATIGTQVTVTGTGFAVTDNLVQIGQYYAGKADSSTGTSLTFTVPQWFGPECSFISTPGLSCASIAVPANPGEYPLTIKTPVGTTTTSLTFKIVSSATSTATTTTVERAPLRISTVTVPEATVGTQYSALIQGTGGTVFHQWDVLYGSLPNGITARNSTINCTTSECYTLLNLVGTPTAAGSYTFIVRLKSSDQNEYVTKELVLNVRDRAQTTNNNQTSNTNTSSNNTANNTTTTASSDSTSTSSSTSSSDNSTGLIAAGAIVGAAVAVSAISSAASSASSASSASGAGIRNVFGGRISYVQYCTCSTFILLFIYDVDLKSVIQLLYIPGVSTLKDAYNIFRVGPQVLGGYTPGGGACMVYAGTSCVSIGTPIGIIDTLRGIGSSKI